MRSNAKRGGRLARPRLGTTGRSKSASVGGAEDRWHAPAGRLAAPTDRSVAHPERLADRLNATQTDVIELVLADLPATLEPDERVHLTPPSDDEPTSRE